MGNACCFLGQDVQTRQPWDASDFGAWAAGRQHRAQPQQASGTRAAMPRVWQKCSTTYSDDI